MKFKFGNYKEFNKIRQLWSYPGSKFEAIDIIYPYLRDHKKIASPFLGGGSLEINLAYRGHEVVGYDYFFDIANLWQQITTHNEEIYEILSKYRQDIINRYNVTEFKAWYKEQWKHFFDEKDPQYGIYMDDLIQRAGLFYMLQQCSFSMIIGTATASTEYKSRISKGIVEKIKRFPKIIPMNKFKFGGNYSFVDAIPKHINDPEWFIYLDPPYLLPPGKNNLYGTTKETHDAFDHKKLAEMLKGHHNWLMSYNDSPAVRELYPDNKIIIVDWKYVMNKSKKSSEILIFG